jgi:polyhydroxyalkanoate synthesis regulator phasin
MTEEKKRPDAGDSFREGVRAVTGILGALREAIEHSFDDITDRGDMSSDKAKDAAKETMHRAEDAMNKVRDRLDFATRKELEDLRAEVAELRRRLDAHEGGSGGGMGAGSSAGGSGGQGAPGASSTPPGAGDGMPPL